MTHCAIDERLPVLLIDDRLPSLRVDERVCVIDTEPDAPAAMFLIAIDEYGLALDDYGAMI